MDCTCGAKGPGSGAPPGTGGCHERQRTTALVLSPVSHQPQSDRLGGGLRATRHPQLVEDADHVVAGRERADDELRCYLLVRAALRYQKEDLLLPLREGILSPDRRFAQLVQPLED